MSKKKTKPAKKAPTKPTQTLWLADRNLQLLVVAGLILLTYFHTLDVPFYYDDNQSLRGNAAIQDISVSALWNYAAARIVGYFTFALNYAVHGYDLGGYHLVNILIHIGSSLVVYFLAALILETPRLQSSVTGKVKTWLPLLAAVLFAIHPLQTQAVTYIVQRLASLVALFYLLAMFFYLKARLSSEPWKRSGLFVLSVMCFVLALFTKQNAVTLPLALLLLEVCFLEPNKKLLAGGLVTVALVAIAAYVLFPVFLGQNLFDFINARTQETDLVSRTQYLSVQIPILWSYLFKFVFPLNLVLNYEQALPPGLFDPLTFVLLLLHGAMLVLAALLVRRQPILAFGILFYYLAHLIESSIIPIRDFGFDHRTYLPNTGLVLIVAWLLSRYLLTGAHTRAVATVISLAVLLLATLTWQRNNTWRDPVAFFSHEVAINDTSFRAYCLLGEAYYEKGEVEQAVAVYRQAQSWFANRIDRRNNTEESCYANFAATLQESGRLDEASRLIAALGTETWPGRLRSKIVVTQGNIEALRQNYEEAEALFIQAGELDPGNIDAISNLAKLKILTNEFEEAFDLFQRVNRMDPTDPDGIVGLEYLSGILQPTPP